MERSDYPTLTVLGVVTGIIAFGSTRAPGLLGALSFHIGLLAAFGVLLSGLSRAPQADWTPLARAAATIGVLHALYFTAGTLGLELTERRWDGVLSGLDSRIFGLSPAYWTTPGGKTGFEFFCLVYILFLPFIYAAIAAGVFSGPSRARKDFLAGLALVYALSLPWHILLPAQGPRVLQPERFAAMMDSGVFHRAAIWLIDKAGGPHGAFPSLHGGASAYCCLFELRYRPRLGACYAPFVVLVAISAVFTGYHYAVDLLAGWAFAVFAERVARSELS